MPNVQELLAAAGFDREYMITVVAGMVVVACGGNRLLAALVVLSAFAAIAAVLGAIDLYNEPVETACRALIFLADVFGVLTGMQRPH
ncbi:hypothetical protein EXIGLDRAFT_764149 [Exidia glandulosa HHB12029]|uniref:Uncharacterized protein n=1 Tax=Exidia glandulosa HHB12029 TaxID=1314781 RepID=A0A165LG78_EXIGL|nr:hypothetical protein EXIGLDRAFT_764149 [Exidia glandulosa HHB12029]